MKTQEKVKEPISHELIFKIMFWVTMVVTSVFLIKNIISFNLGGIIATAVCLVVFASAHIILKKMNVADTVREFLISMGLMLIVFIISQFSGASYSDDFPLLLAIIGMTGMYLEPKFTKVQIVLGDVLLVLMYILHPEKAGSLGQYILCAVMFTLAAVLFYLAINRGRSFIEVSRVQTAEAESLVQSIREMGDSIQEDFDNSSRAIEESTIGLRNGSESITEDAEKVSESCLEVHDKIITTEEQISELNAQVKSFEHSLSVNRSNMEAMKRQLRDVSGIIAQSDAVFGSMKEKMNEVAAIAHKLGDISFRTTLLSLNASVEAANEGSSGFAVVASEMKVLAENSDAFAVQVTEVVNSLLEQVEQTSSQFADSTRAIEESEAKMGELQESFSRLTAQFSCLYDNIDEQNRNISEVDSLFGGLQDKVMEMRDSSEKNQDAVNDIARVMDDYRANVGKIVENTRV